ncbi:succinylglutamate desuccinylase/aspartoacylase family protein (plasmid) [Haloferax larsenii]|uniref:Succinylglutamate desuccinylase/aspartoacylase family protein n=1 Tax=Haloferax larsenii TaxID=302484 RepID=A0ABY5RI07_HALLR|nr:succinylglutamate desuccinylase/aspartoacylase family protein [Haloferax larsenii]UVE52012.1 succinylglutamate desuccinylase/aspartoacylase family protein [Haloferax larsenii]
MSNKQKPFVYDGGVVEPGETANLRFPVSETYLGEPVRIPVTIIVGSEPGPTAFLSAAIHGDELNGIEVVREVAHEWDLSGLHGTLVCLPVLNPQGFVTQQRYLPIYDRDLNRSFPGDRGGTSASRLARAVWTNFIEPCDFGLDFHTSTRGRTNMFQVRADMADPAVARLANAYGTNLIISGEGSSGMLRRAASEAGIPTITLEMGEAHRFEREFIDHALDGVRSVLAEYAMLPQETVHWPGWRTVIEDGDEKTWLRADTGGIIEMASERGDLVHEGEVICTISNPFKSESVDVRAPFTGLLVGVLANPVVYPGNPLCHFVALDEKVERIIELNRGESHG